MYRQLYQMGGIGTLPMDYGQALQVPNQGQMPAPNYSSAQSITSNPLLNYGQTQLAQGGATPLSMRGGGITRLNYQEGGIGMVEDQTMIQPQMPQQMDPKQALELIIQMLIAQGIPPEQAREIALQMVQAVAEGGMEEMSDERVEARFGGRIGYASGGIGSLVNREQYGFGSIFKSVGKAVSGAVKGVTNAVKSVVSSPLGKAALTVAAIYATGGGALAGGPGFGSAGTLFGPGGALGGTSGILGGINAVEGSAFPGLLGVGGEFAPMSGTLASGISSLIPSSVSNLIPTGVGDLISKYGTSSLISGAAGALGGALAGGIPQRQEGETDEQYQARVDQWKLTLNQGLSNPTLSITNAPLNLYPNNPFYAQRRANGGRIGYAGGGIGDLISQVTKQEYFGKPMLAEGGIPLGEPRQNQAGITELDYRQTGGFVPPIGIKERADDIPAMLSNNEFVFTADAVRNAGGGDENLGAKRMYKLMKNLENGGRV